MKKAYILLTALIVISCNEDFVDGPAVGFYPTGVIEALEEDGVPYQVSLAATGDLSIGGVVQIEFNNHEFIQTVPAHTNGVFQLNIGSGGSGLFTVEALNDDLPNDYVATFRITDTGGDITGIANSTFSFVVKDDDTAFLFADNFEDGNLDNWETENVGSGNEWTIDDFSGNTYADISNFLATSVTENWLISPEITFSGNETLSFMSQTRFNEEEEIFQAYFLSGYTPGSDPSSNATLLSGYTLDPHTGGGFGDFTESGEIDLSDFSGTGRIAFYYKAGSLEDGSGWSLDDVFVIGFDPDGSDGIPNDDDSGGNGGSGGNSSGGSLSLPFFDDFESCVSEGQYNIPSNWFEENVPGFNTDRGWGCRDFGVDGTWAPRASAYVNSDDTGEDDSWMISNGTFDLTGETSVELSFYSKTQYSGPGKVTVYWSTNYSGSGDPTSASWTEMTDVSSQMNSLTTSFQEITGDLSGAVGEEIYLAFRYTEGKGSESIAIDIDDLCIGADCSSNSGGGGGGGNGGSEADCSGSGDVFSEDFEGQSIPGTWTISSESGGNGWEIRDYNDNFYAMITGYAGDATEEDWLVMPSVSLNGAGTISFGIEQAYATHEGLSVLYSTNFTGSVSSASWTNLNIAIPVGDPNAFEGSFTCYSADLGSLPSGSYHFAFRFNGGTDGDLTGRYHVDDVLISSE